MAGSSFAAILNVYTYMVPIYRCTLLMCLALQIQSNWFATLDLASTGTGTVYGATGTHGASSISMSWEAL